MDIYFNMNKVKYTILDTLFSVNDITLKDDVNVFINLENIILRMTNEKSVNELSVDSSDSIFRFISNVVNIAAHYRLYFTKNGVKSNIYLYLQYPFKSEYKNKSIIKNYRSVYDYKIALNTNKHALEYVINESMKFLKIIFEYIEGVHIIQAGEIESSVIPKIIMSNSNKQNYIVTTMFYDFQYVSKNTNIIYPKGDNSKILTKDNIMTHIIDANNIKSDVNVSHHALPFILSMVGDQNRNIENIKGVGIAKTLKLLTKAIEENMITENTKSISMYVDIIDPKYQLFIKSNYSCCSVDYQYNQLNEKDLFYINSQIVDKFDNESLKILNDTYFIKYPLYLVEITSLPIKEKKKIEF